jgi:hypothetical protein
MRTRFDTKRFSRDMNNIIGYSRGFLEGAKRGRNQFLTKLGAGIKEILKNYIDSNARVSPETLHHVYEWYSTGSPEARLFDISYKVIGQGISFSSSFRQSTSVRSGSNVPFYDKARIMEKGIPVVISPTRAQALVFEDSGTTVFTKAPITVSNPGGKAAEGGFERAFDSFFRRYLSQSVMESSGLKQHLKSPLAYKKDFTKGVRSGKGSGYQAGYRWILEAGEMI